MQRVSTFLCNLRDLDKMELDQRGLQRMIKNKLMNNSEAKQIINRLVNDLGIAEVDIASRMHVSYSAIRSWRLGIRNPKFITIEKLKQILEECKSKR